MPVGFPSPFRRQKPDSREGLERLRKQSRPLENDQQYYSSATNQLILILCGGIASAVLCGVSTCSSTTSCELDGRCTRSRGPSCGFTNDVVTSADVVYNVDTNTSSLTGFLQGLCSPGDRWQYSTLTKQMECVPYYPFPNAINPDITDASASSAHQRACGKWLDAGGIPSLSGTVVHRSMEDHSYWLEALQNAENASTHSPRTAKDAMTKFRAECRRTVDTGTSAIRVSSVLAYQYLASQVENVVTREDVLRASGLLSSHHCDNSVSIGMYLSTAGSFVIDIYDGVTFGSGVLASALQVVGEPSSMQVEAEAAVREINSLAASYSTPAINATDMLHLLGGATGMQDVGYSVNALYYTNILDSLLYYHEYKPVQNVRSYLRGVAAYCAYSLRSQVESVGGLTNQQLSDIKSRKARADAIGRLHVETDELDVDNATVVNATTITLSQLGGTSTGNSDTDCLNFMRTMFPDHVDEARFHATVDDGLYQRMQSLVLQIRIGVAAAVTASPVQEVLYDPQLVANDVAVAGIRIAGAPRGSWAGIARAVPDPQISSTDGVFTMALKQSRALFLDRIVGLSLQGANPCDHPPFSSATTLNAYMIPSLKCSVLFLGMAHRPWLDSQYDDESLMSRGMMVIAHELAHLTLNTQYVTAQYAQLLRHYRSSTYDEAIADVVAAMGIVNTGAASRDRMLTHWCQIWCARTPLGWAYNPAASHPENNERCDFLHATITEHVPA